MAGEENKAALERAVGRWNAGDLEGYLQLYDAACVLHNPPGDLPNLEAIREFYRGFWAAFPGSRLELAELIGDGDKVACRFTVCATHRGDFMGIPPTGREASLGGITVLRFSGGKCVERWNQADFLGLLQQLGAVPAPQTNTA